MRLFCAIGFHSYSRFKVLENLRYRYCYKCGRVEYVTKNRAGSIRSVYRSKRGNGDASGYKRGNGDASGYKRGNGRASTPK